MFLSLKYFNLPFNNIFYLKIKHKYSCLHKIPLKIRYAINSP